MSLKIYIASPWLNRTEAAAAQEKFEAAGFEVTAHWIHHHSDAVMGDPKDDQELQQQAIEDVEDIIKSDVFVILNLDLSEGKATEFGMAYGLGIPVILVGERTRNIFYYLPAVFRAESVEEAILGIQEAEKVGAAQIDAMVKEGEVVN